MAIRIPITILTGFLGAGKTTLLNRLMSEPGFGDTAVIVNEFGEAGVDAALIENAEDRAFAMSTGCLCCTVRGDVRLTLLRLLDEAEKGVGPSFSRVVIETTGLADPAPIIQPFMSNDIVLQRFTLNGIVTLVDAVGGLGAIERFPEAARQAAVADLIVTSKNDLAFGAIGARERGDFERRLQNVNPNARVMRSDNLTAEDLFSIAAFDPNGKPPDVINWLRFADDYAHHQHHAHEPPRVYRRVIGSNVKPLFQWRSRLDRSSPLLPSA